MSSSMVAILML